MGISSQPSALHRQQGPCPQRTQRRTEKNGSTLWSSVPSVVKTSAGNHQAPMNFDLTGAGKEGSNQRDLRTCLEQPRERDRTPRLGIAIRFPPRFAGFGGFIVITRFHLRLSPLVQHLLGLLAKRGLQARA